MLKLVIDHDTDGRPFATVFEALDTAYVGTLLQTEMCSILLSNLSTDELTALASYVRAGDSESILEMWNRK